MLPVDGGFELKPKTMALVIYASPLRRQSLLFILNTAYLVEKKEITVVGLTRWAL